MRNLALVASLILAAACSHADVKPVARDAAGCLAACPGASVVETSQDGAMCRCWQHKAGVQYTFAFPDTDAKRDYTRGRWLHSLGIVQGCQLQGYGWEPTPDGSDLRCAVPEPVDPIKQTLRWTAR